MIDFPRDKPEPEKPTIRAKNGTFLPGNPGGGRPRGITENRQAFISLLTPAKIRKLVRRMGRLAMAGDQKACAYLLDQAIGKALQSIEMAAKVEHVSPEQKRQDLTRRLQELGLK